METWFTENVIYFLAAVGIIFNFLWLNSFKKELGAGPGILFFTAVVYAALDYFFAKIFAVIEYLDFSAFSRLSLFGAVFFMPFAVCAFAKAAGMKSLLLLDISTPGLVFFFMCGRINCLLTGCCYGVNLTENLRWPVREAEITLYLILIIIFCVQDKKGIFTGRKYALFLIVYGIFRFAAEFVRYFPDQSGLWHKGHVCAAIAFAGGLIWYIMIRRRQAEDGVIMRNS